MKRKRTVFGALVAAVLLTQPLDAFELKKRGDGFARWEHPCVSFAVDSRWPETLRQDTFTADVTDALEVWNHSPCSPFSFTFDGVREESGYTESNLISVATDTWHEDEDMLAYTLTTIDVDLGYILDTDVVVNGNMPYAPLGVAPAADQFDLTSVLVHELGHALGLDHSGVKASVMASGMPLGRQKRLPANDDREAVCALYPRDRGLACPAPEKNSGCSCTTQTDGRWSGVIMIVLGGGFFLRRRRKEKR